MSKPPANPARLSSLRDTGDPLGVGDLFRQARELPDEDLPRLRWRLRTSHRMRAMRPRLVLKVALVVGVVFCMGGVVGAFVSPFRPRKQPAAVDHPADSAPSKRKKARPQATVPAPSGQPEPSPDGTESVVPEFVVPETGSTGSTESVIPEFVVPETGSTGSTGEVPGLPVVEPGPGLSGSSPTDTPKTTPAASKPAASKPATGGGKHRPAVRLAAAFNHPVSRHARGAAPEVAPSVAPSPIAAEQALLGQAIQSLREGHDARTALALLAQHEQRFPSGALVAEASMLRIEALLALGRRAEALSILDRVPLAWLPNRDEQLVVRGELRANAGRWQEAKQDFDDVLERRGPPRATARARYFQERALWGRASARSRLGDQDGARADLAFYLQHFPDGRFSAPARRLLKGAP